MSFEWLADPQIWIALITLSTLEIVLGVDNLVFISIAVSKLPHERRNKARRFGIALACVSRILLLLSLAYLARMQTDLFSLFGMGISIRDLVLILGGVFLVVKGAMEIRDLVVGEDEAEDIGTKPLASFGMVIAQIAVIDIVFSLDSVITAVGMVSQIPVMVAAILIAVVLMLVAANPLGEFIDRNPTIKMLALGFIVLVGVVLIADGLGMHIPRGYLYVAMAFSAAVESLNLWVKRRVLARESEG
ncbi:MAG TPA: TerC family protein [Luteimonas sp.]|nr:TerC family protein [Luteimonas sp.]